MGDDESAKGALNSTGYRPGQSLPSSLQSFLTPSTAARRTPLGPKQRGFGRKELILQFTKVPFIRPQSPRPCQS